MFCGDPNQEVYRLLIFYIGILNFRVIFLILKKGIAKAVLPIKVLGEFLALAKWLLSPEYGNLNLLACMKN